MISPSLLYVAAAALQGMATVAVVPALTRSLGEAGFGQYAVALVAAQLLGVVVAVGVPAAAARAGFTSVGKLRPDALLDVVSVGALVVALGLCTALLLRPVWSPLLGSSAHDELPLWVATSGAGLALTQLALSALRAEREASRYLLVVLASSAVAQGAGAFAAAESGQVEDFFRVFGILVVAAGGFGLLLARWPAPVVDVRGAVRNCFTFGGPSVVVHSIGVLLIAAGDRWVIDRVEGNSLVGRYQVAYVIGSVAVVAVAAVNNQWSIDYYATHSDARDEMLERSSTEVMRFAVLVVTAVCGLTPFLLPVLGGPDVDTSSLAPLSATVAFAAVPYVLYLGSVHVLFARGRTAALAVATAIAAAINVGLNLLVVPILSIEGAAATTFVTYVCWAALVRCSARSLSVLPPLPMRLLAALGLLALGVVLLDQTPDSVAVVGGGMVAVIAGGLALRQIASTTASW